MLQNDDIQLFSCYRPSTATVHIHATSTAVCKCVRYLLCSQPLVAILPSWILELNLNLCRGPLLP